MYVLRQVETYGLCEENVRIFFFQVLKESPILSTQLEKAAFRPVWVHILIGLSAFLSSFGTNHLFSALLLRKKKKIIKSLLFALLIFYLSTTN